jgi:hypothetical protein
MTVNKISEKALVKNFTIWQGARGFGNLGGVRRGISPANLYFLSDAIL